MYLHLSGNTVIRQKDIVGIFDMDTTTVSQLSRDFLRRAQENGSVCDAGDAFELPKSFVVTADGTVYLAPPNSVTLQKRCQQFREKKQHTER